MSIRRTSKTKTWWQDKDILFCLMALVGLGLIQVYSSSFVFALETYDDSYYFFRKQSFFSLVGVMSFFAVMSVPASIIKKWAWLLAPVAIVGLVLTLVPGIGVKVGGAKRWLPGLFGVRIEPCEIYKLALPFLLATFYCHRERKQLEPWQWVLYGSGIALPLCLFVLQPDFGSFAMSSLVLVGVVFACGLAWRWILAALLCALSLFALLVVSSDYRMARVMSFLDPWQDPQGGGFQSIQSLLSFSSGGIFGTGLGAGQGKLLFLPEAHTDFTLAVFAEEAGLLGVFALLALYAYVAIRGLQIASRVKDSYFQIVALGLTLNFSLAVVINMGVVMGLLPTKGLTLPFMSYGGSSLVMSCVLFAFLMKISTLPANTVMKERAS